MASRNKLTLNKIKRIFIEIFKSIGNFFKNLYTKFKNLPSKVKAIIIVWLIILIIIIVLIIGTSTNRKTVDVYNKFENVMNNASLEYVQNNSLYGTRDQKIKVDLEELKDANLINTSDIPDNSCKGFSLVYYDDATETNISSTYINCKDYTSEEYYDFK